MQNIGTDPGGSATKQPLSGSNWTNSGQRINPRYDDKYQLLDTHDNRNQELIPMDRLKVTEHIIGVAFTQYSSQAGLQKFKEKSEQAL